MHQAESTLEKLAQVDVLLVEDDDDVRSSFVEILRGGGYTTAEARDSPSALELLESLAVRTILLDVYLPGLSGLWLLDQLDDPPPVVLVTAHDYDPEVLVRRDKVFLYVRKPIPPAELLRVVARSVAAGRGC
jgi:two-component system, NtrC family, phosphoglycerate transport system response regulator PgtA